MADKQNNEEQFYEDEGLKRLAKKRAAARGQVTRILNKFKDERDQPNGPDKEKLRAWLQQIKEKGKALVEMDEYIQNSIDVEDMEEDIYKSEEVQEAILIATYKIEEFLKPTQDSLSAAQSDSTIIQTGQRNVISNPIQTTFPLTVNTPPFVSNQNQPIPPQEESRHVTNSLVNLNQVTNLPKLEIPKFDGDEDKWTNFWFLYEVAIHNNEGLHPVNKFCYLRSYLEGIAANVIRGLDLGEENYYHAIDLLKGRFGSKESRVRTHINNLRHLESIENPRDVTGLRRFFDKCEVEVKSLQSLGVAASKNYGTILCPMLLDKLPEDISLEYTRRYDNDSSLDLLCLLEFLRKEVQSRERARSFKSPDALAKANEGGTKKGDPQPQRQKFSSAGNSNWKRSEPPRTEYGNKQPNRFSAASLTTSTESACLFCQRNHKSEACPKVTEVEERKGILRKLGRCYVCVSGRHLARTCKVKLKCEKCERRHHTAVCEDSEGEKKGETTPNSVGNETANNAVGSNEGEWSSSVLLQTAKAKAEGGSQPQEVRLLIDSGSHRTFILETLSRKLDLPVVGEIDLELHTFGGKEAKRVRCKKVEVVLRSLRDANKWIKVVALETPTINTAVFNVPGEEIKKALENKNLPMADSPNYNKTREEGLSILIGSDFYWRVITGRIEKLNGNGLTALESTFGWIVQGPMEISSQDNQVGIGTVCVNSIGIEIPEQEEISRELRRFWELESMGIRDPSTEAKPMDEEAIKVFNESVQIEDGRYCVKLPWSKPQEELSLNYLASKRRLLNLIPQFKNNPELFFEYRKTFNYYLEEGIVEPVFEKSEEGPISYLPHRPVVDMERETTKVRIVFDGSARERGKASLNECVLTGPHLNPDLLDVLVKFRLHRVVITADIEKAFLQIKIHNEDRNAVRFLWFQEPVELEGPWKIIELRFTRVLFGVSASPFLLAKTIRYHAGKYSNQYPETSQVIGRDTFADDLLSGEESEEKAYTIAKEAREIFQAAKMNLRKFQTNSSRLRERLRMEEFDVSSLEDSPIRKVLGLPWNPATDDFSYEVFGIIQSLSTLEDTKRSVLKISAKLFDPLGLISPFVVKIKMLFQRIWQRRVDWDDPLPEELAQEWHEWCADLENMGKITIPRFYGPNRDEEVVQCQLHCFSDASERAYGAVLYVRYVTETGKIHVSMVASKTRVAPIKKVTLPRLELLGALIGARLTTRLRKMFTIQEADIYYWSDSTITISWIRGSPEDWKPFVSNRVSEIQTLTEPHSWNHCTGKENPADVLSMGQGIGRLQDNTTWWHGPSWLSQAREFWLKESIEPDQEKIDEERRVTRQTIAENYVGVKTKSEPLLNLNKYEEVRKLVRVTAWVKRYTPTAMKNKTKSDFLTTEELWQAKLYWIKLVQRENFEEEYLAIKNKEELPLKSKIAQWKPFLDEDDVIRIGGRLQESEFSFETKHPILLPNDHRFTHMIIMHAHQEVMHTGTAATLTQLREMYWVPKARQTTKRVLRDCLICKKWGVKPMDVEWAPLPKDRVKESSPFMITGVDFAGPIYIKGLEGKGEKAYIALFTCGTTRAIHLELVSNLSTECFLLAFRRFVSRRGLIHTIYSDNAKTFQKANRELIAVWKHLNKKKIGEFLGSRGVQWKFIIERAPWYGGFYERLVKSVKMALKKTLGNAFLNFEEMVTVLTETEATINSRPITYLNDDSTDPEPLTPGNFLIGRRLTSIPQPSTILDNRSSDLRKRWKYQQTILNRLWQRWNHEYLLELKTAHEVHRVKTGREIRSGDVVLISDEKLARQQWRLARVLEVHVGRDGRIRSCSLKLPSGMIIRRAIKMLCLLEAND